MSTRHIGRPTSRVDGRAKVTGAATYVAEFQVPELVYGVVVSGSIARGRGTKIDASAALAVRGVIEVLTHENAPRLARRDRAHRDKVAPSGSPFRPLQGPEIVYSGQPVALVLAESFELARHAAGLVRVACEAAAHETDLAEVRGEAYDPPKSKAGYRPPPKPRGDAARALAASAVKHEATYTHAITHHHPMETHATTVVYEHDGTLTIHDKTQGAQNSRDFVAKVFELPPEQVRVISPFIGGAFGSGLRPQYQLTLAVMAARALRRSVRVVLTRQQMFTFGYRPRVEQKLALGSSAEGRLEAITHDTLSNTSRFEHYCENVVPWSGVMYQCANVRLAYKIAQLDLYTPIDMRGPGAASGVYALECAIDELADKRGEDPLALRLRNYAEHDQNKDRPFSSKALRDCYEKGAGAFGWARRTHAPRSMRSGDKLVGWGMATGIWESQQMPSGARAVLTADGRLQVSSCSADIGPGTYTIMTQIAAETLGLPLADVSFSLGDSAMPQATIQGGSATASSVGSAVLAVCEAVKKTLFKHARKLEGSPLASARIEDVEFVEREIRLKADPSKAVGFRAAMRQGGLSCVEEQTEATPDPKRLKFTCNAHAAVFVEVEVDEALGEVTVTRVVSAVAGGRILNPKTARSQILGGVVWGMGMALYEESMLDHRLGRFMNHSLAEYHVPVNADVRDIEVIFVEERDDVVNPLGAKGLGEIGIVGVAAAIANAVFHATGKRVRDLPITLDKLL